MSVIFQYDEDFDHERVVAIAEKARATFEGMPELRSKVFTVDDARRHAPPCMNRGWRRGASPR